MAQRTATLLDECRRVSAELDEMMAEMSTSTPSQARHERHIDQVEQIILRLRKAARGPGRPDPLPVNPPLAVSPDGHSAIW